MICPYEFARETTKNMSFLASSAMRTGEILLPSIGIDDIDDIDGLWVIYRILSTIENYQWQVVKPSYSQGDHWGLVDIISWPGRFQHPDGFSSFSKTLTLPCPCPDLGESIDYLFCGS